MKKVSMLLTALVLLAFTVITQTAQAQMSIGVVDPGRLVISPYYQADASGAVYTFIGVSHPSLAGSTSQVGVRITSMNANGVAGGNPNVTGTQGVGFVEFTISGGTTNRVFIVVTNHATLNPQLNTNVADTSTFFIAVSSGTDSSGYIDARSSNLLPNVVRTDGDVANLNQLQFWGAVVVAASSTGFAMEFIGDAHDTVVTAATMNPVGTAAGSGVKYLAGTPFPGRGIN